MGTLAARTGPDGVRRSFTYDSELKLLAVANPDGASWSYSYDPAGQLVAETDFNGRRLEYAYDVAGRLIARTTGTGQRILLVATSPAAWSPATLPRANTSTPMIRWVAWFGLRTGHFTGVRTRPARAGTRRDRRRPHHALCL